MNPIYPVYIISKGRSGSCLTARSLDRIKVDYYVVIEQQEYDKYCENIDNDKILILPFSNLGMGSTPARNWCWDHAISTGNKRHWILDDNIEDFNVLNRNNKPSAVDGSIFRHIEIFTDRYSNIALAGMNYYSFAKATDAVPPYYANTRIYSCILIDNSINHRWRLKYNEDTDLSLCVLKSGLCTCLFNAFLCGKVTTLRMKGGNTDELYKGDGRLLMAQELQKNHPDVCVVSEKFGRPQHHVNYKKFRLNAFKKITEQ